MQSSTYVGVLTAFVFNACLQSGRIVTTDIAFGRFHFFQASQQIRNFPQQIKSQQFSRYEPAGENLESEFCLFRVVNGNSQTASLKIKTKLRKKKYKGGKFDSFHFHQQKKGK